MRLTKTVNKDAADVMATNVTSLIYLTRNKVESSADSGAFPNNGGVLADLVQDILVACNGGVAEMIHGTEPLHHCVIHTQVFQFRHKYARNLLACLVQIIHFSRKVHTLLILVPGPSQARLDAVHTSMKCAVNFSKRGHIF